jgi:hypothetical protein
MSPVSAFVLFTASFLLFVGWLFYGPWVEKQNPDIWKQWYYGPLFLLYFLTLVLSGSLSFMTFLFFCSRVCPK